MAASPFGAATPWVIVGTAVVGLYALTRQKKKRTLRRMPYSGIWALKFVNNEPQGPAPFSPEWVEAMAVRSDGIPLLPGEFTEYVRGAVWWSNGTVGNIGKGEYDNAIQAALQSLQGGSRGLKIHEGENTFKKYQTILQARIAKRAALLPKNASPAGQGPPMAYWLHNTDTASWNMTVTDWYGRHYAGGSMWDNFSAMPAVISDGVQSSVGIIWKGIKAAAPYLELAASFIPVYGPWIVAAIHLAYTGDLEESAKAAIRAAIPGGPIAQMGVDFAIATIEGEPPDKAALTAFFNKYPEAKMAYDATMAAKDALKSGDIPRAIDESTKAYNQAEAAQNQMKKDFS